MSLEILNNYLKRINWEYSAPKPDLATLTLLQKQHTHHIPFENLNPFLGILVKLDSDSLQRKFLQDHRGGYCFEHSLFFKQILEIIGFKVKGVMGRVWRDNIIVEIPENPRTHMILVVDIDNTLFHVDVGFGGLVPTQPLLLKPDSIQKTTHEDYKFIQDKYEFTLSALVEDQWRVLYTFNLAAQYFSDFEMANWFTATHQKSLFTNHLIVVRRYSDGHYALKDNRLTTYAFNKDPERKYFVLSTEIKEVLQDIFDLPLYNLPGLNEKLTQIIHQEHHKA
ncbi:arylamine N-acetyltransferase family protein [Candidatus Nitrosacidococcus tergens]|uniref:Putative N-hydroxyarylamine O-acetyltransferase n=1 Tax=Candidatus Nitrosacidococcus tergens TaxID=553981 RepID=A0A7G1Q8Y7_9GAMM|nr:arylamine N-acetyltransferase [Candidatus Nitrosacidococcus tergens]CAB1275335.1 putative N-hydroxyarylamine O-acetyltransferase [Candidatus Nitrosacidococcus tergens]